MDCVGGRALSISLQIRHSNFSWEELGGSQYMSTEDGNMTLSSCWSVNHLQVTMIQEQEH